MKFSVITCTFNSAEFLQKNIESVSSQNFIDFEHVFIDGGSTDKTIEIIKNYQKNSQTDVRLYSLAPKGISNAMNNGIKFSTGEYVIHLHSDDALHSDDVLSVVNEFLELHNPDWIYGKINIFDDNSNIGTFPNRKLWHRNFNDSIKSYFLKFYNYIPHQAVFIRKDLFDKFGYFDEKLSSSMDFDLWLRLRRNTKWRFFDKIISNYRLHKDSQSSGLDRKKENKKNYINVQKKYCNYFENVFSFFINVLLDIKNKNYR